MEGHPSSGLPGLHLLLVGFTTLGSQIGPFTAGSDGFAVDTVRLTSVPESDIVQSVVNAQLKDFQRSCRKLHTGHPIPIALGSLSHIVIKDSPLWHPLDRVGHRLPWPVLVFCD